MASVKSPKYSMKGWTFHEWAKGNYKTIKELVKTGLPLIIGWTTTNSPELTGVITILGKLVLDSLEYWAKEY